MRHIGKFAALRFFSGCTSRSGVATDTSTSRSSVATDTSISTTQIRGLKGSEVLDPSVASKINDFVLFCFLFTNLFGVFFIYLILLLGREESESKTCEVKMKSPSGFLVVLPNISIGVHKLVRSLKFFSQLFGKHKFFFSLLHIYIHV